MALEALFEQRTEDEQVKSGCTVLREREFGVSESGSVNELDTGGKKRGRRRMMMADRDDGRGEREEDREIYALRGGKIWAGGGG